MADSAIHIFDHHNVRDPETETRYPALPAQRHQLSRAMQYPHDGFIPMQRHAALSPSASFSAQAKAFCDVPDAPASSPPCYRCSGAGFSVDNNLQRRGDVCAAINKNMAHANSPVITGMVGLPRHSLCAACAAARSAYRCTYPDTQHFIDQRTVRIINRLNRRFR